jgi:hypothetical protein
MPVLKKPYSESKKKCTIRTNKKRKITIGTYWEGKRARLLLAGGGNRSDNPPGAAVSLGVLSGKTQVSEEDLSIHAAHGHGNSTIPP